MRTIIVSLSVLLSLLFLCGCAAVVVGTAATTSAVIAQDRRTTGTIVEDKTIQIKALKAVLDTVGRDPEAHISVVTYNNRVVLVGQVPSYEMKKDIERAVHSIEKVRQLHNELVVDDPTTMLVRSKDSWITTRVKSEMALTKDLNPTRIKVVTENGVVYLIGIVTPLEEEIAVDIAKYTKGVKKVVKIFEYEKQ